MPDSVDQLEVTQPVYIEPPLYCRACGAHSRHECICPRYEIPLPELDL